MLTRARLGGFGIIGLPLLLALASTAAPQQPTGNDYAKYTATAITAAPPDVTHDATIVRMTSGVMQTLKKGSNEYTCMIVSAGPMCMAPTGMGWMVAWQTHAPPPDALGFIYMLNGDTGMSNTDPWAIKRTAGNHWLKTGPHIMMVGTTVKKMTGFPRMLDPDPTKPYVSWPGTPYEHVVIPMQGGRPR